MTFQKTKAAGLALGIIMAAGIGHAATLSNGGVLCEGPNSLLSADQKNACKPSNGGDGTFGDGPQSSPGEIVMIDFAGSGHGIINGGIRGKNADEFNDVFQLKGTGKYNITLTALDYYGDPDEDVDDFDATWFIGNIKVGNIGNVAGPPTDPVEPGPLTIMGVDLSALTEFKLVAGGGIQNNSVMQYEVKIEAVPLPAGVVLLLTGLGGLGLMRRRAKA